MHHLLVQVLVVVVLPALSGLELSPALLVLLLPQEEAGVSCQSRPRGTVPQPNQRQGTRLAY